MSLLSLGKGDMNYGGVFVKNHFRTFKWFEMKDHLSFNVLNLFLKDKGLCRNNMLYQHWELALLSLCNQDNKNNPNLISNRKGFLGL